MLRRELGAAVIVSKSEQARLAGVSVVAAAASDGAGLLGPVLAFAGTVIAALIAAAAQIRADRKKGDSFTLFSRASTMLAVAVLLAVVGTATVVARSQPDDQSSAEPPTATTAPSVTSDSELKSLLPPPPPPTAGGMSLEFDGGVKADSTGRTYVEDASGNRYVALILKDNGGEVVPVSRGATGWPFSSRNPACRTQPPYVRGPIPRSPVQMISIQGLGTSASAPMFSPQPVKRIEAPTSSARAFREASTSRGSGGSNSKTTGDRAAP